MADQARAATGTTKKLPRLTRLQDAEKKKPLKKELATGGVTPIIRPHERSVGGGDKVQKTEVPDEWAIKSEVPVSQAAKELKKAIDDAQKALENTEFDTFDAACKKYTKAARSFAAVILAERIRRSFEGRIDSESRKSTDSADAKIDHAKDIRKWLAPWNLGFRADANRGLFQIFGSRNETSGGQFRLTAYGRSPMNIARWPDIEQIVARLQLDDVTQYVHRFHLRGNITRN